MLKEHLEGVARLDKAAMAQVAQSLSGANVVTIDNREEGECYVIISNDDISREKRARFALVAGYFEEAFWSGVMLVGDEFLSENAALLTPLKAHLKERLGDENIALSAESCVFVEQSALENEDFSMFIAAFCNNLSDNLALSAKLNEAIADFA